MSMEIYNYRSRKAKKQHKCEMCGKTIEIGEIYSYECGKWEGDFFDRKMHEKCFENFTMILNEIGEDEFSWDWLSEWWHENRCYICKNRYLPCKKDEQCEEDFIVGDGICPELTAYGTCKAGDTCDEMTHVCWCEKFEPVTT